MNNYNDYYNYLNSGFSDMNYMTNPNSMITDMNMSNNFMPSTQSPTTGGVQSPHVSEPFIGFKRGNMFADTYDEYKNFKPQDLKASSEREDLLMQIQELTFATIDLNIYLDIYPNDKTCLDLFNKYLKQKNDLVNAFEKKYGPLTTNSPVQTNNWLWNNSPWPWEVQS